MALERGRERRKEEGDPEDCGRPYYWCSVSIVDYKVVYEVYGGGRVKIKVDPSTPYCLKNKVKSQVR